MGFNIKATMVGCENCCTCECRCRTCILCGSVYADNEFMYSPCKHSTEWVLLDENNLVQYHICQDCYHNEETLFQYTHLSCRECKYCKEHGMNLNFDKLKHDVQHECVDDGENPSMWVIDHMKGKSKDTFCKKDNKECEQKQIQIECIECETRYCWCQVQVHSP